MSDPIDSPVDLTPEEIERSWDLFKACGDDHEWVAEPKTSVFYRRCHKCGGAEGIRFPEGIFDVVR